ncbi:hypothetical protein ACFL4X_01450 [Gemmatimonadota bacterium]
MSSGFEIWDRCYYASIVNMNALHRQHLNHINQLLRYLRQKSIKIVKYAPPLYDKDLLGTAGPFFDEAASSSANGRRAITSRDCILSATIEAEKPQSLTALMEKFDACILFFLTLVYKAERIFRSGETR